MQGVLMKNKKNSRQYFGIRKNFLKFFGMIGNDRTLKDVVFNVSDVKKLSLPKSKRSQLKIQEMMFMLLGVFLFFILAGLLMLSILNSNIRESANKISEENNLVIVRSLSNSPEFICTNSRPSCIDGDKLIGLIGNKNYQDFWPFSSLMIVKESGFNKSESKMTRCNAGNYPNCDVFVVYDKNKNERAVSSFVALCRKDSENFKSYEKCEIAKIIAGSEVKG